MAEAVRIVNDNTARIPATLRASGTVDGYFMSPAGHRRSYHVDGILFYLAPTFVRFDLKALGNRQFLFGSNKEHYWFYDREEETYHCGRHRESDELEGEIPSEPPLPVRPEQIIHALGLAPVPAGGAQRVVPDYQQILFLEYDEQGQVRLEKECWLDRYEPRLIGRVIYRDASGVVIMESSLDDYRPLAKGGPLLPCTMSADWPQSGAQMRFRVARWTVAEGVGPGSIQFAAPRECEMPER